MPSIAIPSKETSLLINNLKALLQTDGYEIKTTKRKRAVVLSICMLKDLLVLDKNANSHLLPD